jgi:hypothetical protein
MRNIDVALSTVASHIRRHDTSMPSASNTRTLPINLKRCHSPQPRTGREGIRGAIQDQDHHHHTTTGKSRSTLPDSAIVVSSGHSAPAKAANSALSPPLSLASPRASTLSRPISARSGQTKCASPRAKDSILADAAHLYPLYPASSRANCGPLISRFPVRFRFDFFSLSLSVSLCLRAQCDSSPPSSPIILQQQP